MVFQSAVRSTDPAMGSSLLEQIEALSIRVNALENKQTSTGGTAQEGDHSCEIEKYALVATDPFACKIYVKAIAMGLRNVKLVRARDDYYNHDLPWRRRYLRAPSTEHLCKSVGSNLVIDFGSCNCLLYLLDQLE